MAGMASIRIERRPTPWVDRARAYKVAIDGERMGSVGFGQEQVFEVAPGRHQVQLHIDWCRSRPVEVDVAEGAEVRLACSGRNAVAALYWMVAKHDDYIVLEHAAGG